MRIVALLQKLGVSHWRHLPIARSHEVVCQKLSGAMTNMVYFIMAPQLEQAGSHEAGAQTASGSVSASSAPLAHGKRSRRRLLLRIFGPMSDGLIDRAKESATLRRLGKHGIGPRLIATFANGRFEQWLDCAALSREEMRSAELSSQIAWRMREFHDAVPLHESEIKSLPLVWQMWYNWLPTAKNNSILYTSHMLLHKGMFDLFVRYVERYRDWLDDRFAPKVLADTMALCHNDVCLLVKWSLTLRLNMGTW